jgi:outer membrane lipoprotein-sorting protein
VNTFLSHRGSWFAFLIAVLVVRHTAAAPDPAALVKASFEHYRGQASEATIEMVIHRPDWERRMEMRVWTEGTENSLIRIVEPPKDRGNGTLKKGAEMWTFNPKVNRVIKLPPAMMSQSWMGSDFSNNDLAKSDTILDDYTHELTGTETRDGHTVYVIESTPKPQAPVVWGMLELKIRDDDILLEETFFDEDREPVKRLTTDEVETLGGRLFPKVWTMREVGQDNEYTLLRYHRLEFKDDLPDSLFTLGELKTPRRR